MAVAQSANLLQILLGETSLLLNELKGALSATASHSRRTTQHSSQQSPTSVADTNTDTCAARCSEEIGHCVTELVRETTVAIKDATYRSSEATVVQNEVQLSAENANQLLTMLSTLSRVAPIMEKMQKLGTITTMHESRTIAFRTPTTTTSMFPSFPSSRPPASVLLGSSSILFPRTRTRLSPPVSITHSRSFWSERKLQKLELEAADPAHRLDARKQAELYKELLKSGNHYGLIDRYENQPQLDMVSARYPAVTRAADVERIQNDPECAKAYVTALAREGNLDRLTEKILAASSNASENAASAKNNYALFESGNDRRQTIGEPRDHWMQTNVSQWEKALGRPIRSGNGARGNRSHPGNNGAGDPSRPMAGTRGEPIEVVLSEAWSWSKFVRKLGSKVLYGLLLMTGLSVLLDQQGIIKSGMGGTEVEPNSLTESIKFADVQGVDEAKHELEEIVAFLKEPKLFMDIGGKLPKGVLLYGPPGTGKTHLARAVAGEAGVPFFQMSGSEFDELYVGVGARRVRELFAAAKKKAPCIVFIDELDAVGSKRSAKDQSYMRQTLNQLLVELDGFSTSEGVIFIAATNTPEALDKALVRPGRFDRLVPVPLPDVQGRANILEVHMKGVTVAPGVDTSVIARGTPGFSGADLANLINQAAIKASKDGAKKVRMQDMEWAKDKIIMGSERKSAVVTEQNKRLTAYHEGGHTLVALYTNGATPLHKVTVIPRGNALGVTVQLPEADKTNHTKRELYAMLDVCMGGRVAEEMVFGPDEVTTGASSDLEKATAVAREMVLVYGMSDKVGVVGYGEEGWDKMSPVTKGIIEAEVKGLLDAAYARATQLLKTHKEELHRLARALMEHETLNVDEVKTVVKGGELKPLKTKLKASVKEAKTVGR